MELEYIQESNFDNIFFSVKENEEREKEKTDIQNAVIEIKNIQNDTAQDLATLKLLINSIEKRLLNFERVHLPKALSDGVHSFSKEITDSSDKFKKQIDNTIDFGVKRLKDYKNVVIPVTSYYIMWISLIFAALFVCLVVLYDTEVLKIHSLSWITVPIISLWTIITCAIIYFTLKND